MTARLTDEQMAEALEWAKRNTETPAWLGSMVARALLQASEGAARYRWAKPILSGDNEAIVNERVLFLAAGLMRNETIDQTIDSALAALAIMEAKQP